MDSLWWGMSTITTVGFGDIVPVTTAGRIIGLLVMGAGVILFVGTTALFISVFFARINHEITEGEDLAMREHRKVMSALSEVLERLKGIEESVGPPGASQIVAEIVHNHNGR